MAGHKLAPAPFFGGASFVGNLSRSDAFFGDSTVVGGTGAVCGGELGFQDGAVSSLALDIGPETGIEGHRFEQRTDKFFSRVDAYNWLEKALNVGFDTSRLR